MRIEIYNNTHKQNWDDFVKKSKNGLFLFQRDYMEYHSDRFADHSLLIWDEKDKLIALLPANIEEKKLISHGGLTYGGFVTDLEMKASLMLAVFDSVLCYLMENNFTTLVYKTVPHLYHKLPAEEDRYALFLINATLIKRSILTVIDNKHRLPFQDLRARGVKKALKAGLIVEPISKFESYWKILETVLWETHSAKPVHSCEEIISLHTKFPENIKLYGGFKGSTMVAGVVVYETDRVARAQYIATNEEGRECGALDMIFSCLISEIYSNISYFDFSSSDLNNGFTLNKGLIFQKEGFGGRSVVHDQYEIDLSQWQPGSCLEVIT